MSVTASSLDRELGSDASLEAAAAAFFGKSPAPVAEPAPSRAVAPTEERAPETARTDAAADAAPTASDPEGTESTAPERTTYPKSWKGTEAEWQAHRAAENTRVNKERDRAEKAEAQAAKAAVEQAAIADRLAFLEAQLGTRDTSFAELLAQAYNDPRRAEEILAASREQGNQQYFQARTQQEAETARLAQSVAEQELVQRAGQETAEATRLRLFSENLLSVAEYAVERGVVGLDLKTLLTAQFDTEEIAPFVKLSRSNSVTAEEAEEYTALAYKRAIANVKASIDAGKTAHTAASAAREDTTAGRQTALGTGQGNPGSADDFSEAGIDRALDTHYKNLGWNYSRPDASP